MLKSSASTAANRDDLMGAMLQYPLGFTPIGTQILRPARIGKMEGTLKLIKPEDLIRRHDTGSGRRGGASRGHARYDRVAIACEIEKHERLVLDTDRRQMDDVQLEETEADIARRAVELEQEIRIQQLIHNTTTWPLSGTTGHTVSTDWSNTAANVKADIATGKAGIRSRSGLNATTLQIPWKAVLQLSNNADLKDAIKYVQQVPGVFEFPALAAVLGLRRVIAPDTAVYNSAAEGQTLSVSEVWDDNYAFLFVEAQTENPREVCVGRTFYCEEEGGMGAFDMYRDDGEEADILRYKKAVKEQVLYSNCGYLIDIRP